MKRQNSPHGNNAAGATTTTTTDARNEHRMTGEGRGSDDDVIDEQRQEKLLTSDFHSKVEFMATQWIPLSSPSNRDRLELYSLHKQATLGNAPSLSLAKMATTTPEKCVAERSKYQAWKSKAGLSAVEAMTSYILEADRQIRVYGSKDPYVPSAVVTMTLSAQKRKKRKMKQRQAEDDDDEDDDDESNDESSSTPSTSTSTSSRRNNTDRSVPQTPQPTPRGGINGGTVNDVASTVSSGSYSNSLQWQRQRNPRQQPLRGLAAIPLLCAAAGESRPAYIRRVTSTTLADGWWKRQVPLCVSSKELQNRKAKTTEKVSPRAPTASPSMKTTATTVPVWSLVGLPELAVLQVAVLVENVTLKTAGLGGKNIPFVASLLWPLHNSLLAVWVVTILYVTTLQIHYRIARSMISLRQKEEQRALRKDLDDNAALLSQRVMYMSDKKQALSVRLLAMTLMPIPKILNVLNGICQRNTVAKSMLFTMFLMVSWWYWLLVVPTLIWCLLCTSIGAGVCFALIDLAGV